MQTKNRLVTVALAAALIAGLSGSALADVGIIVPEFLPDPLIRDQATDRPVDVVTDRPDDEVTDRLADKPSDVCPLRQVDRHTRCVSDRPTDRPVDRCLLTTDYPRRCINDHRPHERPSAPRLQLSQVDMAANSCPRVGEAGTTTSCTRLALISG